jgi:hypothetical protein
VNPANGNVSGKTLANVLQQKDRRGYLQGKNGSDLYEAARFSQAFPAVVGNSGTATRNMDAWQMLASLPAGLASRAYLSAPVNALARGGVPLVNGAQNAIGRGLETGTPLAGIVAAPSATNALLSLLYGQQQ